MKNRTILIAALFFVAAVLNQRVDAQVSGNTTDVPRIMSYQGQITTTNGIAMNGTHIITATLYSDPHGTLPLWRGSYDAEVKNGIFTISLGSGTKKLSDNAQMNQPLWVGIRVDEGEEMQPRTQLASVPYALNVPDKSITFDKLAPEVALGMRNNHTPKTQATGNQWSQNGDAIGAMAWLGSTDNYPVEIHVDNSGTNPTSGRVMRFDGTNILGGYKLNTITGSYNVIGGGGYQSTGPVDHINTIGTGGNSFYCFLGGGADNTMTAVGGVIGGGGGNSLLGEYSTITGGKGNRIGDFSATSPYGEMPYSFIGGGFTNTITSQYASIVGGGYNTISTSISSDYSAILGGANNTINGTYSSILGGQHLTLGAGSLGFLAYSGFSVSAGSNVAYLGNVDLLLDNTDGTARKLKFYAPGTGGLGNYTSFEANTQFGNITYILPGVQGTANTALVNNGTGGLRWDNLEGMGAWTITGNSSTSPPANYLGTNDASDFEIHVYNGDAVNKGSKRVMGFYRDAASANIIGGYQGNALVGSCSGDVICGGGYNGHINSISGGWNTIAGGITNSITSSLSPLSYTTYCFIGGGNTNTINFDPTVPVSVPNEGSVIVGGENNSLNRKFSSIVGGSYNVISAPYSFIGGGGDLADPNTVGDLADFSFIGGGAFNTIDGSSVDANKNIYSFIGGGNHNQIHTDPLSLSGESPFAGYSAIAGGKENEISEKASFIGGGEHNIISEEYSVIGGGISNSSGVFYTTIGGGKGNQNIGGGVYPDGITVAGEYAFIGGGYKNTTAGLKAVICGGWNNIAGGEFSFIGGGGGADETHGTHLDYNEAEGFYAVVTGGRANHSNSAYAVIAGGDSNQILRVPGDPEAGWNTIGGGEKNLIQTTATHATVPGGDSLVAESYAQTVIGHNNLPQGASTKPVTHADLTTINSNDRIFIIGNGTPPLPTSPTISTIIPAVRSNAYEVTNDGRAIVYGKNASPTTASVVGTRSIDNTPVAWGDIDAAGNIISGFGIQVAGVTFTAPNIYLIKLNYVDPNSGSQVQITNGAAIVVTPVYNGGCITVTTSRMTFAGGFNQFTIRTWVSGSSCSETPEEFMFNVFARP